MILAVLIGLAGLEGAAFLLFAHDKATAREHRRRIPERTLLWTAREHRRRIPERTLLWAALWGGVGAWLACQMLRHKTRKEPFRTLLGAVVLVHLVGIGAGVWWMSG